MQELDKNRGIQLNQQQSGVKSWLNWIKFGAVSYLLTVSCLTLLV